QYGFAIRHSGAPAGVMDKSLPILHAFGGRLYSPDGKVASGYINSAESVAAFQFLSDLVYKYKVSSVELPIPEDAFGQKLAASIYRESHMIDYQKKNYNLIAGEDFAFAALPSGAKTPGICVTSLTNMVYKFAPDANKEMAWEFLKFMLEPENDWKISLSTGGMPLDKSLWVSEKDTLSKRADFKALEEMLQRDPIIYDSPVYNALGVPVGIAVQNILFYQKDVKAELDIAAKAMDNILNLYYSTK
ncbi:MAG: extracellular solute-binding protein, partial [Actinobacteria bacterium]|nr:extracellular solute-binding protein [Actinomycetota bacterium]